MTKEEPVPLVLYVGQTKSGAWLVRDQSGTHVGIFRTRTDADHYVRDDLGDRRRLRFVDLGQCTLKQFIAA
jgi:hypothetical protein